MRHFAMAQPSNPMDGAAFAPPAVDDRPFGAAFRDFKVRMFLGGDFRICTFRKV
jgi:hypothetical protein